MSKWWIPILFVAACGARPTTSSNEPRPIEPVTPVDPTPPAAEGPMCGTRGAAPCEAPMFCNFRPGAMCGRADAPGRCEPRPEMCAEIYKPVCGCDGKTYPNDCSAASSGVGVMSEGECPADATP